MLFNKDFEIVLMSLPYRIQSAFIYMPLLNWIVKIDSEIGRGKGKKEGSVWCRVGLD